MIQQQVSETKRIDYLDGLRGFAAFAVLIGHSFLIFSEPLGDLHAYGRLGILLSLFIRAIGLLANSNSAVCIFFLLSGYVMADFAQTTKLSLPAQLARRYLRLAIPILITSTLAYLLLALGFYRNAESARIFGGWAGQWYQFAPSAASMTYEAMIGTFATGSNAYNPNLWTMHPELLGSLGVLLIGAIGGSRRWRTALYIGFAAYYIFDYLPLFAVGALMREYDDSLRRFAGRSWWPIAIFALGFYICTLPEISTNQTLHYVYPLPRFSYDNTRNWHSIGATLLLIGLLNSPWIQRPLGSRLAKFLGRISFTLYLIHIPILCSFGAWLIVALASHGNAVAAAIGLFASLTTCLGLAGLLTPAIDGSAIIASRKVGRWLDAFMNDVPADHPSPEQTTVSATTT